MFGLVTKTQYLTSASKHFLDSKFKSKFHPIQTPRPLPSILREPSPNCAIHSPKTMSISATCAPTAQDSSRERRRNTDYRSPIKGTTTSISKMPRQIQRARAFPSRRQNQSGFHGSLAPCRMWTKSDAFCWKSMRVKTTPSSKTCNIVRDAITSPKLQGNIGLVNKSLISNTPDRSRIYGDRSIRGCLLFIKSP